MSSARAGFITCLAVVIGLAAMLYHSTSVTDEQNAKSERNIAEWERLNAKTREHRSERNAMFTLTTMAAREAAKIKGWAYEGEDVARAQAVLSRLNFDEETLAFDLANKQWKRANGGQNNSYWMSMERNKGKFK